MIFQPALLVFSLMFSLSLTAQPDSKSIARQYQISLIENPQTFILTEFHDGRYSGQVITKWTKGTINRSWLQRLWDNLWNVEWQKIETHHDLSVNLAKQLLEQLKHNGIETLKPCDFDNNNCGRIFLDGDAVRFKVKSPEQDNAYYFEEIYPYNGNNKETHDQRLKAQTLITILYQNLDVNGLYADALSQLERGKYFYPRGAGVISFKIK